jgi:hypothetical protein
VLQQGIKPRLTNSDLKYDDGNITIISIHSQGINTGGEYDGTFKKVVTKICFSFPRESKIFYITDIHEFSSTTKWYKTNCKVKQSLYSLGEALGVAEVRGFKISRQSAHEGGKFVSPTHQPPLPQEI